MKKFWNLMLAALVIIGATACTENYDGIEKAQNTEGFSFYAEVVNDGTRAYIADEDGDKIWNTVWKLDDKLIVKVADAEHGGSGSFEVKFVCTDAEKGKFTSTDSNAVRLQNQSVTITTNGNHHSLQGKEAFYINTTTTFDVKNPIELEALTSFFRYTFNGEGDVVLTTEAKAFIDANGEPTNTVTISGFGEHFVAFWPGAELTTPFTLTINGETVREKVLTLVAGKVYNLGTYEGTKHESFGIVGDHQGWNQENLDALYLIPGSNTYVRRNVKLAADGFKFLGSISKTTIVEHPAIVEGQEADLYLKPNSNWTQSGAWFAAYFFNNKTDKKTWVKMEDTDKDGIYGVNVPKDGNSYPQVIFVRMNSASTKLDWSSKWDQTQDLTVPTNSNNMFTIAAGAWNNASGTWSVHKPEVKDAWKEEVVETTTYWVGKDDSDNISNWVTRWSNNGGGGNIKVSNLNTTYDIYFHKGDEQDWGFEVHYIVLEHGSAQPALK